MKNSKLLALAGLIIANFAAVINAADFTRAEYAAVLEANKKRDQDAKKYGGGHAGFLLVLLDEAQNAHSQTTRDPYLAQIAQMEEGAAWPYILQIARMEGNRIAEDYILKKRPHLRNPNPAMVNPHAE